MPDRDIGYADIVLLSIELVIPVAARIAHDLEPDFLADREMPALEGRALAQEVIGTGRNAGCEAQHFRTAC